MCGIVGLFAKDAALEAEERVLDEAEALLFEAIRAGRCADGLGPPAFFCAPLLPADDVAFGEVWARQLRGMRRAKRGQGGLGLQCAKRGQVLICFAPHWLQRRRRLADGQVYAPATTAPRKNGSLLRKEQ